MGVGGGSRSHSEKILLENRPKIAPYQYRYFGVSLPCVFCLCIVKCCSYYDFSVLSMSAMGFQKSLDRSSSYSLILDFFSKTIGGIRQL